MGMNGWKEPWRLYSKGIRVANFDISTKDKIISWITIIIVFFLTHAGLHLIW